MDSGAFDERLHGLRHSPLLAGLQAEALRSLAASSAIRIVQRGHTVFLQGQQADAVVLVLSGLVQRRYLPDAQIAADLAGDLAAGDLGRSAAPADVVAERLRRQRHVDVEAASQGGIRAAEGERWLHLWAHGPRGRGMAGGGDADRPVEDLYANLVADTDLLPLLGGFAHPSIHLSSAVAVGPIRIIAIARPAFAACAAADAALRKRLGLLIEARSRLLQRAMGDFLLMRDHSHVRLARMLRDLFDAVGPKAPVGPLSVVDMATMLGLSRKQVTDDFAFLKAFGAVVPKGEKRLACPGNGRLALMAEFVPAAEKPRQLRGSADDRSGWAELWLRHIDEVLDGQGNAMLARMVAEKAIRYHPGSRRIAHRHVLACLRDGALDEARRLLDSTYGFDSDDEDEDFAALPARLTKGRLFQTRDRERAQALAGRAATEYGAVYRRRPQRNFYAGINAAAMALCAGRIEEACRVATDILAALARLGDTGYWERATRAEALGILGDFTGAAQAMQATLGCKDGGVGKRTSTFTQFRRLAETTGNSGWRDLLKLIELPPIVFFEDTGAPGGAADTAFLKIDALAPEVVCMAAPTTSLALDLAQRVLESGRKLCCVLPVPVARHDWRGLKSGSGKPATTVLTSRNKLLQALYIGTAADDRDAPGDWLRQCKRTALGLALASACEHERAIYLADAGTVVRMTPADGGEPVFRLGWAAPDQMSRGYCATVRVETRDASFAKRLAAMAAPVAAAAMREESGYLFKFPNALAAMRSAAAWQAAHDEGEPAASIYCDIGHVPQRRDGSGMADQQPGLPAGGIKASPAFAAELALLNRPAAFSFFSSSFSESAGFALNVPRSVLLNEA